VSEFSDLITMKLIEQRRLEQGIGPRFPLVFLEGMKQVKNLNVRAPIHLIGQIETLADYLQMSKAELVHEMLASSLNDAMGQIAKESGTLDYFWAKYFAHMEKNYGAVLQHDEAGNAVSMTFPEESKSE